MISVAFNLQSTQGANSVGPTMFPMVMQTMIFDKFFKKLSLNEVYMSGTSTGQHCTNFKKKLMKIRSLIIPMISKTKQFKKPIQIPFFRVRKIKTKVSQLLLNV